MSCVFFLFLFFVFFFKQKTAYEMCGRDWSSDVCSSDLFAELAGRHIHANLDLASVASLVDGFREEIQCLKVVEDVGSESSLVAHVAG